MILFSTKPKHEQALIICKSLNKENELIEFLHTKHKLCSDRMCTTKSGDFISSRLTNDIFTDEEALEAGSHYKDLM